jgi:putative tricarboxylic transport membrane protein
MIDFDAVLGGLGILGSSSSAWLVVIPGLLIGLAGGALPGVSGTMTMALVLPFTMYMDFLTAMLFLTSVFSGGGFGGAVPAILVNMPGTTSSMSTAFDGYPMARAGKHNEALGLGLGASCFADAGAYLMLFLLINVAGTAVLKLGPVEMFVVVVWGLTMIAVLRSGSMLKGIAAGTFGLLLGTIGIGPTGVMRSTLGIGSMVEGIPQIPAMIGLLATSELFNLARSRYIVEADDLRQVSLRKTLRGALDIFRYPGTLIRGSFIGVIIGIIPGVGASVANLIAYGLAKKSSKDPSSFGHGNPHGVVASESANSSSEGGSMATLLTLGIPSGGGTAVLLAAFAIHNITGGPQFVRDHKDIVYAIIVSNFAQALLMLPVGLLFIWAASAIVRVRIPYLIPTVVVLSVAGSYAMTQSMDGPITLFAFSIIGYVLARFDYSTPAVVIGLLLGMIAEGELVRSYQISGGQLSYVLGRPIAMTLLALLVLSMIWRPLLGLFKSRKAIANPGLDAHP